MGGSSVFDRPKVAFAHALPSKMMMQLLFVMTLATLPSGSEAQRGIVAYDGESTTENSSTTTATTTTAQPAANSTSSKSTSSNSPGNSITSSFFSTTTEPSTPNSSTTGPSSGNSTTHSSGNSSTSSFLSTTAEPSGLMSAATSKQAKLMLVFTTFVMPLGYLYSFGEFIADQPIEHTLKAHACQTYRVK